MVGFTTRAFRILALREGCALAAAEMLAAEYLVRESPDRLRALRLVAGEHPTALQVVGTGPAVMADAARILEALGADVVDINLGCPVRKIVRSGAGAALGRDPAAAARVARAVRRAVGLPVTAKVRAMEEPGLTSLVRALESEGMAAVTVHARTTSAGHRGAPSFEAVGRAVAAASIPVVGNGGIRTPEDAATMLRRTGCAGVMVGRAAIGDASLFGRIARFLRTGEPCPPPSGAERFELLSEHLRLEAEERGERVAVVRFRKCLPHYLREAPGAREARGRLRSVHTVREALELAAEVLDPPSPGG